MKLHVLIAMEEFAETRLSELAKALDGWATWEQIPATSPQAYFQEKLARADVVIGLPDPKLLLNTPVKLLLLPHAGYEEYQGVGLANKPGFQVCNARGVHALTTAEHAVAMMLALARRLLRHFQDKHDKIFKRQPVYGEITGTTACIVGVGSIGMEIARRCVGLGMVVCGVDILPDKANDVVKQVWSPDKIQESVRDADHVFCAAPGGAATRGLFNANVFASMKRGSFFYNIARGSLVEEKILIEYLRNGHLGGAGLDVFEEEPLPPSSPLWDLDNVIITPHCAGLADKALERFCDLVVENLQNYRAGKSLVNKITLE